MPNFRMWLHRILKFSNSKFHEKKKFLQNDHLRKLINVIINKTRTVDYRSSTIFQFFQITLHKTFVRKKLRLIDDTTNFYSNFLLRKKQFIRYTQKLKIRLWIVMLFTKFHDVTVNNQSDKDQTKQFIKDRIKQYIVNFVI